MDVVDLAGHPDATPHLTLVGSFTPDQANFGLGFAVALPAEDPTTPGAAATLLRAQLVDGNGKALLVAGVWAHPVCIAPAPGAKADNTPATFLVRARIPLVDDVASLLLDAKDRQILRRDFTPESPIVERPEIKVGKTATDVQWQANHPEQAPLEHVVVGRRGDGTWTPLTPPSDATQATVWPAVLSAKTLEFAVLTTDGLHTVLSESTAAPAPQTAAQLTILEPRSLSQASPVLLSAHAVPDDPSQTRVVWESSQDGLVGVGARTQAEVSPGKHLITARLTDRANNELARDQVEIVVGNDPTRT